MKIATIKKLRLLGWSFLLVATALAFLWFYWLAPMRHLSDWNWLKAHSMRQNWIETQKQIHRTGVDHDGSIAIGLYGDKVWTEWVIWKIKPYKLGEKGWCGEWPYHLYEALPDMTNHKMTNAEDWLSWWKKNKDKSQVDWIREGFAQNGIVLQEPLTTNSIIALLKLVNLVPHNAGISNQFLLNLRYNALRWLMYSEFRASSFDLKNVPDEDKERITLALIMYAEWWGEHYFDPGQLPNEGKENYSIPLEPNFTTDNRVRLGFYLLMPTLTLGGIGLLFYSRRKEPATED